MARSTFLQLAKDAHRECRFRGEGPDTLVDATGEAGDLVRWLSNYYVELQCERGGNWRFLRHQFTLDAVQGQRLYTPAECVDIDTGAPIDRFGHWRINDRWDYPTIYKVAAGQGSENWVAYLPWEQFKSIYEFGNNRTIEGFPAHVSFDPQDRLALGPTPNEPYRLQSVFFRSALNLRQQGNIDAALHELPEQFEQLIVYGALEKYGGSRVAAEAYTRVQTEAARLKRALFNHQGSEIRLGRAMA